MSWIWVDERMERIKRGLGVDLVKSVPNLEETSSLLVRACTSLKLFVKICLFLSENVDLE